MGVGWVRKEGAHFKRTRCTLFKLVFYSSIPFFPSSSSIIKQKEVKKIPRGERANEEVFGVLKAYKTPSTNNSHQTYRCDSNLRFVSSI